MKKIFLFFIFFITIGLFSNDKDNYINRKNLVKKTYKVIILPFNNNTINNENDFVNSMLIDVLTKELSNFKRFKYIDIKRLRLSSLNNDYNKINQDLIKNNIDLIITGYYYCENNFINIVLKIIDVISNTTVLKIEKIIDSELYLYDEIVKLSKEILFKIEKEVDNKNILKKINRELENDEKNILVDYGKDILIFAESGLLYSLLNFINERNDPTSDYDLTNEKNNNNSFLAPYFHFEIYKDYKNNFYGFGVNYSVPVQLVMPKFFTNNNISASFIFGYKKLYFFKFSLDYYYLNFNKYNNNDNSNFISSNYMGIGLGINFKYLPDIFPFFIEGGITILPPFIPTTSNNKNLNIYNFIIQDKVNSNNWFFPLITNFSFGYFFNNNFGLSLRCSFYLFYLTYDLEFKKVKNDVYYYYYQNIGSEYGLGFRIMVGFIVKNFFY